MLPSAQNKKTNLGSRFDFRFICFLSLLLLSVRVFLFFLPPFASFHFLRSPLDLNEVRGERKNKKRIPVAALSSNSFSYLYPCAIRLPYRLYRLSSISRRVYTVNMCVCVCWFAFSSDGGLALAHTHRAALVQILILQFFCALFSRVSLFFFFFLGRRLF
jgi:hypothetical protein